MLPTNQLLPVMLYQLLPHLPSLSTCCNLKHFALNSPRRSLPRKKKVVIFAVPQ